MCNVFKINSLIPTSGLRPDLKELEKRNILSGHLNVFSGIQALSGAILRRYSIKNYQDPYKSAQESGLWTGLSC